MIEEWRRVRDERRYRNTKQQKEAVVWGGGEQWDFCEVLGDEEGKSRKWEGKMLSERQM